MQHFERAKANGYDNGMTHRPDPRAAGEPAHPLPGERAPAETMVSQCVISFGSNLGERRELITAAAQSISAMDWIDRNGIDRSNEAVSDGLRTSRLFETPPIGGPGGQEPFLNAIGVFETTAPARTILDALQQLELQLGRERRIRWDARSMDLDVVLHGKLVGGAVGLVVPHPRYTARQFVLQPACDVAAHFRDPRFGWTLGELTEHLSRGAPSLGMASGSLAVRETLCQRLADEHGIAIRDWKELPEIAEDLSSEGNLSSDGKPGFDDRPWVCSQVPHGVSSSKETEHPSLPDCFPRLLVRIQQSDSLSQGIRDELTLKTGMQSPQKQSPWPAPHLMWPGGWRFPEYRLEIEDMDWAVSELASALDSMRCQVQPVTEDGNWWR